jgi:hypothetical protein
MSHVVHMNKRELKSKIFLIWEQENFNNSAFSKIVERIMLAKRMPHREKIIPRVNAYHKIHVWR